MTLQEINEMVFKGKLSFVGLSNMRDKETLPLLFDIPLNEPKTARERIEQWKSTFIGRFVFKYPRYYGIIDRLETVFGKSPEWSDFTKSNIDAMVNMLSQKAQSSAKTYLAMIKSVLNDAKDEVELPYPRFADRMNVKSTPSVGVYLNMDDLRKLENYHPENEKESIILAQFLCGCYTGARHSDILQMSVENIDGGFLTYVSQKTKIQATVEAKPILRELLPIAGRRIYSDHLFNCTIRDICRKVGINEQMKVFRKGKYEIGQKWEFVASHTARRSFATNLALLNVPILQIAKRMGHSDIKQSYRYVCCSIGKLDDEAERFFK